MHPVVWAILTWAPYSLSAVQFCSIIFGTSSLIAAAVILLLTGACYGITNPILRILMGRNCRTQRPGVYFFVNPRWPRRRSNDCLIQSYEPSYFLYAFFVWIWYTCGADYHGFTQNLEGEQEEILCSWRRSKGKRMLWVSFFLATYHGYLDSQPDHLK